MRGHPWQPQSPCGPGCVASDTPKVAWPRRLVRLVALNGFLLCALLIAPCLTLMGQQLRERVVRWIFRTALLTIGARFEVHGQQHLDLGDRGALVVNNHISWLDVVMVNAVRPMRAQGKKEIRSWPVIGLLATSARTVYLDRESMWALPRGVAEVADALRAGSLVNVSPEGTTWCGMTSGRFRPAMFQAAIDADVSVVPIALRFRLADGRDTAAPAFIGDETLLTAMHRTVRTRGLVVEAYVLKPIDPSAADGRRELAAMAQAAVNAALEDARPSAQQRGAVPFLHHNERLAEQTVP